MAETSQSRRATIRTLALLLAGAGGLWRFLTPRARRSQGSRIIEVPVADLPPSGAVVLPQHGIAVVRQNAKLHAVGLSCTHLGCTVKATAAGFACPCHGSRFGTRGECVSGPAPRGLRVLRAEEVNGSVFVNTEEAELG